MTCGSCVASITNGLESLDGVKSAAISLVTERGAIEFDDNVIKPEEITERVEDCGFDASIIDCGSSGSKSKAHQSSKKETVRLKIYGMTCSSCSNSVEEGLRSLEGVESAIVLIATEEAKVVYDSDEVGVRDLIEAVESRGFDAILAKSADNSAQIEALTRVKEIQQYRWDLIRCLIFAVPVFVLSMLTPHVFPFLNFLKFKIINGLYFDDLLNFCLTVPLQFGIGARFYKNAYNSLSHGAPTMDVLVCLSTSCAFFFSCLSVLYAVITHRDQRPSTLWDTATMLVTFIMCGKYLENKAKGQTSVALSRLISLVPSTTSIYDNYPVDGEQVTGHLDERTISTDLVQVNDVVILRPGEKVPADGIVITGSSYLSESLITGESFPVTKNPGDLVIGGSVNGPGRIDFRVTRVGSETKLSQIVKLVQDAQTSRAPVQRFADYVSGYFVPTVICLGLGTFLVWLVMSHVMKNPPAVFNNGEGSFMICLRLCISVIVVACPCALGLATPTAVMVGTGVGAQNGILIKGGAILEVANSVDTVLFDKTGTLTSGNMSVTEFNKPTSCKISEENWWKLIGSVEQNSEHPVAQTLITRARKVCGLESHQSFICSTSNVKVSIGQGIQATVVNNGDTFQVAVGNSKLFDSMGTEFPSEISGLLSTLDQTVVMVAIDNEYTGYVCMSDGIRPEAKIAINALKRLGLEVGLVTGDQAPVAMKVAKSLGISNSMVWAGVSPEGKIDIVKKLHGQSDDNDEDNYVEERVVAMVGDGINDSPALAAASLGIAMTGASDVAMEAADIVLLKEHSLLDVAAAIHLSRKSFARIKLNLFWAVIYNVIMIPFAMGFFLPFGIMLHPMVAGGAMAFSSVSVVASSLLLQTWQPPKWMQMSENANEEDDVELIEGFIQTRRRKRFFGNSLWARIRRMFPQKGADDEDIEYALQS